MKRFILTLLVLTGCASLPKAQVIQVGPPQAQPILHVDREKQDINPIPLSPPGNINGWMAAIIP